MKYYKLALTDQPKSSWVLHDVIKRVPKARSAEMPSAFYKFFAPPDADVHMKERYQPLCCPKCGRYHSDEVFDAGFEEPVAIRFKQDVAWTDDRQLVLNDKVLGVLRAAKVEGYEAKPIGKSGWHVMRVTSRVNCDEGIFSVEKPDCESCGQPRSAGKAVNFLSEITVPVGANTFFTTKIGWASKYKLDRNVFLTEDVYRALKDGKVSGPYCDRLLTDDEVVKMQAGKQPAGRTVYLSGK